MGAIYSVLIEVMPIFILIAVGQLLRRSKMIRASTVDDLKKIIVNLALPALLFLNFSSVKLKRDHIWLSLSVFAACTLLFIVGLLFRKLTRTPNRYLPVLFSGFEMGMMGYALFTSVFGEASAYKIAIFDLGQLAFVFFVLIVFIGRQNGQPIEPLAVIVDFFKTPVILAILGGIIFSTSGLSDLLLPLRGGVALKEALGLLGSITQPLICLVLGYELHLEKEMILRPLSLVITRMSIALLLAFAIDKLLLEMVFQLDSVYQAGLYLLFLLPPPFIIPIYMKGRFDRDRQFVLQTISLHVILSLFVYIALLVRV